MELSSIRSFLYIHDVRTPYFIAALAILAVVILALGYSDGPTTPAPTNLSWNTFNDGAQRVKEEKKKLLVDVYTDWCIWCKRMDEQVYSNDSVRRVLQEKYVLVKLDAESGTLLSYNGSTMSQREFSTQIGVNGYPSTLFFDENLKPITILPGFVKPRMFLSVLTYIADDRYKNTSFKEYLDEHSR